MARVLLAEDDPLAAEVLAAFLEECGHTVSRADSAAEAIALSSDAPPEVLVCDHWLRGLDGPSLARQLQAARPNLRVVIATHTSAGAVHAAAADLHALAVLEKPLDLELLARHVA